MRHSKPVASSASTLRKGTEVLAGNLDLRNSFLPPLCRSSGRKEKVPPTFRPGKCPERRPQKIICSPLRQHQQRTGVTEYKIRYYLEATTIDPRNWSGLARS